MSDYDFPRGDAKLESALRAAHRALEGVPSQRENLERDERPAHISEVISQLPSLVESAQQAAAAHFGPLVSWQAPQRTKDWDLVVARVNFDDDVPDFGVTMSESSFEGPDGTWDRSGFARAALAYKREAGWDFSPDESGAWTVMLAPVHGFGGADAEQWYYTGHLTGFVIVHDRDKDGAYESIAHIWTAAAWRRRGVARRLLVEATAHFPITGVEAPYTADGAALLRACDVPGTGEDTASD